jgi:CoA:oxalate CoA-transferase
VLDVSQREITAFMMGESIVSQTPDARKPAIRQGNAEAGTILQDCFRDRSGRWVALSVVNWSNVEALVRIIGLPQGATAEAALRAAVEGWISTRTADVAVGELTSAGIPAEQVLDGVDLLKAKALMGQSIVVTQNAEMVKGMPYVFGGAPFELRSDAPDLGQHTDDVLQSWLGMSPPEIEALAQAGVTAAVPTLTWRQ